MSECVHVIRIYAAFKLDQSASAFHLLRALYLGRLHDPTPHYARPIQTLQHRSPRRPCRFMRSSVPDDLAFLLHLIAGGPSRCGIEKIPGLLEKRFISPRIHRDRSRSRVAQHICT